MPHAIQHHYSTTDAALGVRKPPTEHEKLTKEAQKWVAQTFYGTLLKQVRQSPFHSKQFEGGRGGEAFGSLYDQRLAEHMARGAGHKLVDAITRKIEARKRAGEAYSKAHVAIQRKPSTDTTHLMSRSIHATTALRA